MINYDGAVSMDVGKIYEIYRSYSNQKLPDVYKRFTFGQEIIERAEGAYLTTQSGKTVLDLTGGLGVANFGHNHPRILAVRRRYAQSQRPEIHKSYFNPFLAAASKNLADVLKFDLRYSFFCNSGAEAVEGALKITYKRHNGTRRFVLHSDRSFHGKTLGAGSISAGDNFVGGKGRFYFQKIPNVLNYEFDCFESVVKRCESVGEENVYAIFVEPFSCSTLTETSKTFLTQLRQYCTQHKISLVFDEIYSGFAKCGYDFYFHKYGIAPDVICLSKALGGGKASISAYVATEQVYTAAYGTVAGALAHSTTYNSFGEECATAMEACNILVEENVARQSLDIESYLSAFLEELKGSFPDIVGEVRGSGTHFGLIMKDQMKLAAPLVQLLPIDFTSDPLFLRKLFTTAVANAMWNEGDMLAAFTSNQEVILNVSPAPITKTSDLEAKLPRLHEILRRDPYSLVLDIVKNGFVRL